MCSIIPVSGKMYQKLFDVEGISEIDYALNLTFEFYIELREAR